jgi:repressor LexA
MRKNSEESFAAVQEFLARFIEDHGEIPSVREIEKHTGVSKSAVGRYLQRLEDDGVLKSLGKHGYVSSAAERRLREPGVPVIGTVSCGYTKLAQQDIKGYISLPTKGLNSTDYYILEADGNSMINIGIEPGDYVVCRRQQTADRGQVIVALVNDEATLKRFYPNPEEGTVDLVPENDGMPVQRVDLKDGTRFEIQGVAVRVIRMADVV